MIKSQDLSAIYYDRPNFCVDEQLYPEGRGHIQHKFPSRNAAQAFISKVNHESKQQNLFEAARSKSKKDFDEYCWTEQGQDAIEYDNQNPHVYKLFTEYAEQIKDAGQEKYSAQAIFERIRWHMALETTGDDFKINNNYRPYYARKLMAENSEFEGFFALRSSNT